MKCDLCRKEIDHGAQTDGIMILLAGERWPQRKVRAKIYLTLDFDGDWHTPDICEDCATLLKKVVAERMYADTFPERRSES